MKTKVGRVASWVFVALVAVTLFFMFLLFMNMFSTTAKANEVRAIVTEKRVVCNVYTIKVAEGNSTYIHHDHLLCINRMVYIRGDTPYMIFNPKTCKFEYVACNLDQPSIKP